MQFRKGANLLPKAWDFEEQKLVDERYQWLNEESYDLDVIYLEDLEDEKECPG